MKVEIRTENIHGREIALRDLDRPFASPVEFAYDVGVAVRRAMKAHPGFNRIIITSFQVEA